MGFEGYFHSGAFQCGVDGIALARRDAFYD